MADKEYIEREAARKFLAQDYAYAAADLLKYVPAADVVEVVRCCKCKWWHTEGCAFRKDSIPNLPSADDFCSHGERKE